MKSILDYVVTETIHTSASYIIYRAYHETTSQPVILKQLANEYPSHEQISTLQREYDFYSIIHHHNIIHKDIKPTNIVFNGCYALF